MGNCRSVLIIILFLFSVVSITEASVTTVIDFEGLPADTLLSTQYSSLGVTFSPGTQIYSGGGLAIPFTPHSGINVIGPQFFYSNIDFTFNSSVTGPVTRVGGYVTSNSGMVLNAYDSSNNIIVNKIFEGSFDNFFLEVTTSTPIARALFSGPGRAWAVDDLTFEASPLRIIAASLSPDIVQPTTDVSDPDILNVSISAESGVDLSSITLNVLDSSQRLVTSSVVSVTGKTFDGVVQVTIPDGTNDGFYTVEVVVADTSSKTVSTTLPFRVSFPIVLLARVMQAEAGDQGVDGLNGVGFTVKNRVFNTIKGRNFSKKIFGNSGGYLGVLTQPSQFAKPVRVVALALSNRDLARAIFDNDNLVDPTAVGGIAGALYFVTTGSTGTLQNALNCLVSFNQLEISPPVGAGGNTFYRPTVQLIQTQGGVQSRDSAKACNP